MAIQTEDKAQDKTAEQQQADSTGWHQSLVCRACQLTITHPDFAIEKNGTHEHLQVNPQGITFVFGCFNRAPGVFVDGEPTDAFSWFKDHAWQYAHCQGCGEHLGWFFSGKDDFFGLLSAKLKSQDNRK